jgi:hypothetical protein
MSKKKSVKASKASSAYSGINTYNVDLGPFASASSQQIGNSLNTQSTLSPELQGLFEASTSGLANNLSELNKSPVQQLQDLNAGNNGYYNLNAALNQKYLDQQTAAIQHKMAQNGLDNSTVNGGLQGAALSDAVLKDLATRQTALDTLNQQANQNASTQNNLLQGLASFLQNPASMSNQQLQNAYDNLDEVGMFNAQQQQLASAANAQLANQRAQLWSNLGQAALNSSTRNSSGGNTLSSLLKGLKGLLTQNNSGNSP